MKFSLRNLILANCFVALGLGALLGDPGKNVQKNQDLVELISDAKNFEHPVSDDEINQFLAKRSKKLAR